MSLKSRRESQRDSTQFSISKNENIIRLKTLSLTTNMKTIISALLLLALVLTPGIIAEEEIEERDLKGTNKSGKGSKSSKGCKAIKATILTEDIPENATSYEVDLFNNRGNKIIGTQVQTFSGECFGTGAFVFPKGDQIFYTGTCKSDINGVNGGTGKYMNAGGEWKVMKEKNGKAYLNIKAC